MLTKDLLDSLKQEFDQIKEKVCEYELYIKENGLPFLDYKMNRRKSSKMSPFKKFQIGMRRICRIVRSYKINDIQGLLMAHRDQLAEQKRIAEAKLRPTTAIMMRGSYNHEDQEPGGLGNMKLNTILDLVSQQHSQIKIMRKEIKKLRKEVNPEYKTTIKNHTSSSSSSDENESHSFSKSKSSHTHESKYNVRDNANVEEIKIEKLPPKKLPTSKGISFDSLASLSASR